MKHGFTLAEILITIGIIGVVSAMTIPTLMNNIHDKQFKTAAQKQYSVFSQAYASILSDNGGTLAGLCANTNDANERNCFATLFAEKINFVKRCYATDSSAYNTCFVNPYTNMDSSINTSAGVDGTAVLPDGSSAWFVLWYPDCDKSYYDYFANTTHTDYCGWIAFDVNGLKKPNTVGKDIYGFGVFSNSIKPQGAWGRLYNDCKTSGSGWTCLYKVMSNIPY